MTWSHPELGPIRQMPRRHQAEHVWCHLYDPAERWGELAPADPRELHEEAVANGCPPFRPSKRHPPFDRHARRLLQRHHDQAYGPAYRAELELPDTRWAVKRSDPERWVARSPRAVIIIVVLNPSPWVLTAYRPLPPLPSVGWSEDDAQAQADYVFEKETGMAADQPTRLAQDLVRFAQAGGGTPRDAWWLALAVARARARVQQAPALEGPLKAAENALAAGLEAAREAISGALVADDVLDRLAEGLKDEHPAAAEMALSDLEDALLVLDTLELDSAASDMLERASSLLAWLPAAFTPLGAQAALRMGDLGNQGSAAALWSAVEECLEGAQLRASAPVRRPAASLVDSLLPAPGLLDRLAGLAARSSGTARGWLDQQLATFDVRAPAPVMGQAAQPDLPWPLIGQLAPSGLWLRAFVVDAEYPDGYDVTDLALAPGATLWQLEQPGQVAHVVVVAASTEVPGDTLAEVLDAVEQRDDAVVLFRRLTRPR
jgi:hypothetical protein